MNTLRKSERTRLGWIKYYEDNECSVAKVCSYLGIARATFYRWYKRYRAEGDQRLLEVSRRPHHLGGQRITEPQQQLILKLRKRKWGPQRISMHLLREHNLRISKSSVWRILVVQKVAPLRRERRKEQYNRYSKNLPGDRVQVDSMKVAPGRYQFTTIDDCTRVRVVRLYPRRSAKYAVEFLGEMLDGFDFPSLVVLTDWGTELFNQHFQYELHEHFIKFRPIKPRAPHLNGNVEYMKM